MTASEILNIVTTVGLSQLVCELLTKYFVYGGDDYKRKVAALERARWKLEKAEADAAKSNKYEKRLQFAKDDFGDACAKVSTKHTAYGFVTSIFFVILLRILGAEYKGHVIGVLPFVPYRFLSRITARGLDWSGVEDASVFEGMSVKHMQGISFLFIYMLAAASVKSFVSKAVGTQPPTGADGGLTTAMQSPIVKKMMRNFGMDPDELLKPR